MSFYKIFIISCLIFVLSFLFFGFVNVVKAQDFEECINKCIGEYTNCEYTEGEAAEVCLDQKDDCNASCEYASGCDPSISSCDREEDQEEKQAGGTEVTTCDSSGENKPGGVLAGLSKDCAYCGNCEVCDFLTVVNNIVKVIFGIFGGVAFVMFLWSAGGFIFAAGNPEKIQQAKNGIISALIGILIIAFAWQIVHIIIAILGPEGATLFGKPWDNPCLNL